jgi:hypothetical protein
MQIDMHYYGSYALARMAGFSAKESKTIATAAQFVDEAIAAEPVNLDGSGYILPVVSAHEMLDWKNGDLMDQWRVWVPFHFLPGGKGDKVKEKLVCLRGETDNLAAEAVIKLALEHREEPYGLHLLGIVTHVLQDTYAHYGFAGIASDHNMIEQSELKINDAGHLSKYVERKARTFIGRFFGSLAEGTKLGHASVATYPDRPYLKWEFEYTDRFGVGVEYDLEERNNQETFYLACTRLHALYYAYSNEQNSINEDSGHLAFRDDDERKLKGIIETIGKKEERCDAWRDKMKGQLFDVSENGEFDEYDDEGWGFISIREAVERDEDPRKTDAYLYNKAAGIYVNAVTDEILPALQITE